MSKNINPDTPETINFRQCESNILDLIDDYMEYSKIIISSSTLKYQIFQSSPIKKFFIEKNLIFINQIDDKTINDFILYTRKTCKNITINKRIIFLKAVYRHFSIDFPYLLNFPKLKQEVNRFDIIPIETLKEMMDLLINKMSSERPQVLTWKLICFLLLDTGMRQSELLEIKIKNIDLKNNRIKLTSTKTKITRYAFISKLSKPYLEKYISLSPEREYLLFNYDSYNRFTYRHLRSLMDYLKRKLSLKKMHAHMFRHTMATLLCERGCPLDTIQIILGHKNISTTQIYLHMSLSKTRSDYDRYTVFNDSSALLNDNPIM